MKIPTAYKPNHEKNPKQSHVCGYFNALIFFVTLSQDILCNCSLDKVLKATNYEKKRYPERTCTHDS